MSKNPDFRSDRMESPEGKGVARRAWEAYAGAVNSALLPLVAPAIGRVSVNMAVDLAGFWLVWHLHGGFEGLRKLGMSRSAIYRKVKLFRTAYGAHPDEFVMPGVLIDPAAYLAAGEGRKPR